MAIFDLAQLERSKRSENESSIRDACFSAYLGGHITIARVLGRYKMYLDTRDVAFTPHIITDGYWEMWHTEAMAQLIKPGMKAADLGANHGYFTLLISELVGNEGTVHAFEPNPHIANMLRNTVEINGFEPRTTVHQLALSNEEGDLNFFIDQERPMNASLVEKKPNLDVVQVHTQRFDDMEELADVDFVKIDVEGAEEAVWEGMKNRLAKPTPLTVILEFRADRYSDPSAFFDSINRYGFSVDYIDPNDGIVPIAREAVLAYPEGEDQLLLLRR